jgi:hypothetical protein
MSSKRLNCVKKFIQFLLDDCITERQAQLLLGNLSNPQIKAISEIVHNLTGGKLKLNSAFQQGIKSHTRVLKKISKEKLSLKERQKLIKRHWALIWDFILNLRSVINQLWH